MITSTVSKISALNSSAVREHFINTTEKTSSVNSWEFLFKCFNSLRCRGLIKVSNKDDQISFVGIFPNNFQKVVSKSFSSAKASCVDREGAMVANEKDSLASMLDFKPAISDDSLSIMLVRTIFRYICLIS